MIKKFAGLLIILAVSVLGSVAISKTSAAGANLIPNASVETVGTTSTLPASWNHDKWGTNTTSFTYMTGDGHTGSRSLYVNMTKHTSGDAKWYFQHVPIAAGQKYTYSNFYKSNVATEVDAEYTSTAGKLSYVWLGDVPASSSWSQASFNFTTPSNAASLSIFHLIAKVGWVETDDFSLTQDNAVAPTPPSISLTAPANGATISGIQTLSASASDTAGVAGVQFQIDGTNLGAEDTTAPYSTSWDTTKIANGIHTISAIARNTSGLTTTASENVNVQNVVQPVPPTVQITAPAANSMVSGTIALTASASSAQGITSVQFKLNGNSIGGALTASPYTFSWNSASVANGTYTLTATATDKSNLSTTSSPVTITVNNQAPVPPPATGANLITNPSFETSSSGTSPDNWQASNWGTNTTTFSYLNTGHTGNHSVKAQTTAYTNGAANWYYDEVPVTPGTTYQYSNWYQSNVDTEVDAEVTMSDGTTSYYWLGAVLANPNWTQFKTTFTAPAGAKSMSIYQILAKVGYIVSDDYSLATYTPVPFNRAIVSVSFDDGWTNQYTNAFPLLQKYGIPGTFNIISGELTDQPDYMTATQVKNLFAAGEEIASHTVTHPDLTQMTQTQITNQLQNSQATLQNLIGAPVTDFAYPFGAYNATTINIGKQYYQSQRTVNAGLNTRDNLDLTQLKIYEVDSNISQAQVKGWIDAAIAQKSWLILVYHEIAVTPTDPTDSLYDTQPSDLDAELAYIHSSGIATETVHQAINEILPQL